MILVWHRAALCVRLGIADAAARVCEASIPLRTLLPIHIASSGHSDMLANDAHAIVSGAGEHDLITEMAARFRFGFQRCRGSVRAFSGAGVGLSEPPELIATHSALKFSS